MFVAHGCIIMGTFKGEAESKAARGKTGNICHKRTLKMQCFGGGSRKHFFTTGIFKDNSKMAEPLFCFQMSSLKQGNCCKQRNILHVWFRHVFDRAI